MISLDAIQGAWRIEEAPEGHPYGFPNTHWLIVDRRVMVIRDKIIDPRIFDTSIYFNPGAPADFFGLAGPHGGPGYASVDVDLLLISFGRNDIRPPRFASDCGLYFAFIRDDSIPLPIIEPRVSSPLSDPVLGSLTIDATLNDWTGTVPLVTGKSCDFWISDELRPIEDQIRLAREVQAWLTGNLAAVNDACGERVREWISEDVDVEEMPIEQFSNTITVDAFCIGDFDVTLWASTSVPIDHSLRVWLKKDSEKGFVVQDVSVEG